jgi:predicted nucleic acid-binding protein
VTRYLLDTSIISDATKAQPPSALIEWLADQSDDSLFISSLTAAEILRGIFENPAGKKRLLLEHWFAGPEGPPALFDGRVLPFDTSAALIWARLMAEGTKRGHPRSPLDMVIAAIAEASNCIVVTGNEKRFAGLKTLNPMRASR